MLAKYKYRDFFFFPYHNSFGSNYLLLLLFHRHQFINIISYYLFIDNIERQINNVNYMIYKGTFTRF